MPPETPLEPQYVPRPEFTLYCKSVNGDLADLKHSVGAIAQTLEERHKETREDIRLTFQNTKEALDTSNAAIKEALATSNAAIEKSMEAAETRAEKALEGTMSKSYAIIISILTGLMMTAVGIAVGMVIH